MLCSECNKNPAILFYKKIENGKESLEGYCYDCAKAKGINPNEVLYRQNEILSKDNVNLNDMTKQFETIFKDLAENINLEDIENIDGAITFENNSDDNGDGTGKVSGAAIPLSSLFSNMFGNSNNNNGNNEQELNNGRKKVKVEKKKNTKQNKKKKFLDTYGTNLTAKAKNNELDIVIGRDNEIRRIIQILNRRSKNNPCLIGEPGVGKTAIAQGLAIRIANQNVPAKLLNKEVYLLDMTAVIAGTQFRGQFESRMKGIIDECKEYGNIILVIDEIHNIIGAGDGEHSMNAANILKPALSNGEIQLIGTTTLKEYRKYIEKDSALERRFQQVLVEEPNIDDSIGILEGIKKYYEEYHKVKISLDVIKQAVIMSEKYIHDRFLPDKAIDLIDEACAMIKTELESMPTELDEVSRKIMQLEIEETALSKEKDEISKQRLADIQKEKAELKTKFDAMKAKWENEKASIGKVQKLREEIEQANAQMEQAERNYDLNKVAELKYGRIPDLQKQLQKEEEIAEKSKEDGLLRHKVTEEEITKIISKWTGIPVSKLMEGEREKILNLDKVLHKRVIGQDEAVEKVSEAIMRSRAGISDPRRPIGSFMFLGPTGVGKTELAKSLAEALFDDEHNMIRIDMSEYMEKHAVSRLVGAPPGYVGYEEGGQLTEAVRRKPYIVILFDEIEKAHEDVFNMFLQILDDGRLTDNKGKTVDFKNTIIIMTSNIGSSYLLENKSEDGIDPQVREEVMNEMKMRFKPEFLNRVDDIIMFKPLSENGITKIIDIFVNEVANRLRDRNITLDITPEAKHILAVEGYDPVYGARPLKRYIQNTLENKLARLIIAGEINYGSHVIIDGKDDEIVIKTE